MGFMDDDSRGFLISLDLLIAIIPLTLVMGMMVTDMDNVLYTMEDTVYHSSLERVGADAVNTLIKTSGTPNDWEMTGTTPQMVGLADYDVQKNAPTQNYLSSNKLVQVNKSNVESLIGPGYDFYMTVTTVDDNRVIKTLGTLDSNKSNIVRIERLVISTNLREVTSLKGLIRDAGQPRVYTTTFPTNQASIDAYDYWVLIENRGYHSATVDVNNNRVVAPNEINQETEMKKKINETFMKNATPYQDNTVSVRTESNPGASMDVYIIAAPKGTPESEINLDNVEPKECRLVFYIWTV